MRATHTVLAAAFFLLASIATADVAIAACGNGILEGGEECDPGGGTFIGGNPSNASCTTGGMCFFATTCCKFNCQFVGSGPSCFDGNDCTTNDTCDQIGNCNGGGNAGSGSNCNDGQFCTATDTCNGAGVCVGSGNPCSGGSECNTQCNEASDNCFNTNDSACSSDGNACTNDVCNGSGSCTHPNNAAACNDGLFCNGADTCSGGACTVHAGDPCAGGGECGGSCMEASDSCSAAAGTPCTADANACTDDVCNGTGACTHPANSAPCDDGLFCNGADACSGGSCSAHAGDPCTGGADCADVCNETTDNCNETAGSACASDGNVCTNDVCNGTGSCTHPNNTDPCSDGLFCNGTDTCAGGTCSSHAGDPCTGGGECADSCNETSDNCFVSAGGGCTADSNECTDDVCNGAGACTHPANSAPCSDGLFCNGADTCSGGTCSAHAGDPCAAGGECADVCNETADSCLVAGGTACGSSVDDDCTDPDTCDGAGACDPNDAASGTAAPTLCSDAIECTADECNGTGGCANPPLGAGTACGDPADDACKNADTCNGAGACTSNDETPGTPCGSPANTDCTSPDTCDTGGDCVANDSAAGTLAPTLCNDALECTADECNGAGGCQNPALAGGTPCGSAADNDCTDPDTCDGAGACSAHQALAGAPAPVLCDDALECTTDQCNGTGGCQNPGLPAGLACGDPAPTQCSAADTCDGAGVCSPNDFGDGTPCDDGDLCTTGDACSAGACASTPTDCDDGNPCTYDRCSALDGTCLSTGEPRPDCRLAAANGFSLINDPAKPKKKKLIWKWVKGEQTDLLEFGDPVTAAQFELCVFDTVGSTYVLASRTTLVPSNLWLSKRNGYRYKDRSGASEGFYVARFLAGPTGKARMSVLGKGLNLDAPAAADETHFFELDPNLVVQMSNDAGICWSSEFDTPYLNTGKKFKTKRRIQVN